MKISAPPTPNLIIANQTIIFHSSEEMDEVATESVDVIITSPPYNRKKHYSSDQNEHYNDAQTKEEYFHFLDRVWRECYRVISPQGIFFLNVGDAAHDQGLSEEVVRIAEKVGWTRIQDIIWLKTIYGKGHYTPSGSSKRFNNIFEHIYLLVKNENQYKLDPKQIGIPYADKSNIGRYGEEDLRDPGNVWHIWYDQTTGATVKKGHDAPFPIGLPYMCLKVVPQARLVLDPFLGTGTTLAAAHALGIRGIGYEKFPRKELIEKTVQSGLNYISPSPILIPHYELTIQLLLSWLAHNSNFTIPTPSSKKAYLELQIMYDTLMKMKPSTKFAGKFIEELEKCLRNFKKLA